ncbi:hypothetical protein [Stagnihabitans tardus]|uniref:DUF2946 domain-containing protein n=1 Tax=Stagnihabitans tardus TaxID=2699202 RepID=A0AAE5BVN1_9RHOB|nr:hypothetical protein [Stagnihabitans tardus]NBZ89136.1 hypothetical protein [Stagnihabitans tardus]
MTWSLRQILCLCLSLLLGLMGVQTAAACPGEAVFAVQACGHEGVIWLDAQGKPAKPCADCPDCLAAPSLTLSAPRAPAWVPGGAEPLGFAFPTQSRPAPEPGARARAPPLEA